MNNHMIKLGDFIIMTLPLVRVGSRLYVVSGASDVPIYSCRRPESDSTPARNEAIIRMIRMPILVDTIVYIWPNKLL